MANYPFFTKNVEVTIFLQDSRGRDVQSDSFSAIKAVEGYIELKADDPDTKRYRILHKETYLEAKKQATQTNP